MKKILSLFLAFLLLLSPVAPVLADDTGVTVTRIAGANRYDTSINVSKAAFDKSKFAVIASGEGFPDALVGGVLAGHLQAPLLTTPKNAVSDALQAELVRLGVEEILLLGGTGTLSQDVENLLKEKYEVTRLSGKDRTETAQAIAAYLGDAESIEITNRFVADGRNYPDALAGAPMVVGQSGVMLLHAPESGEWIAMGGEKSVPGTPTRRIAGSNRYATAVAIAKESTKAPDTAILVDGTNYPDALSASGYAVKNNAIVLLTNPGKLSAETSEYLQQHAIKNVVVIGGERSVSKAIVNELTGKVEAPTGPTLYDVVRVVDGDTIIVRIDGKDERVRLIGIDTPESVHPDASLNSELGKIASAYTKNLLEGKKVSLELDVQERDQYGRLLAYVFLDGIMVNRTLLTAGMAQIATYPPNVKYVEDFRALEKVARDGNVGLWGDIQPTPGTTEPPKTETPKTEPSVPSGSPSAANFYGRTAAELDKNWNGQIKGNISTGKNTKGEKIYHIPGWPSYSATKIDTSKGERWFSTEREAIKAGWRPDERYQRFVP